METNRYTRVFAWVLALLLVGAIFWWLGIADTVKTLQRLNVTWFPLAASLYCLTIFVRYVKWWLMLNRRFGNTEIAVAFSSSKALGTVMPARLGELAPLLTTKFRTHDMMAAIAVDRLLEALGTTVLAVFACALIQQAGGELIAALILVAATIAASFVLLLYTGLWRRAATLTVGFQRSRRCSRC